MQEPTVDKTLDQMCQVTQDSSVSDPESMKLCKRQIGAKVIRKYLKDIRVRKLTLNFEYSQNQKPDEESFMIF